jgi:Fe-Mn family superoxide dismutase
MNIWINEFNIGELIGVDILLVMDMWEHAYIAEFGLNLKKYSETFLANVNWSVISDNWLKSVSNKNNLYRD